MPDVPDKPAPAEQPPADPPPSAEPPADWRRIHLWQIQPVRDGLVILLVLGIFQLGYVLRTVTVPLLLALLLAYLFEPVVSRMVRTGQIRRPVAAGVIIAAIVIGVGGPALLGASFAAVQTVTYAQTLASNVSTLQASIAAPEDEKLADAVPERWRAFRDFLVGIEAPVIKAAPAEPIKPGELPPDKKGPIPPPELIDPKSAPAEAPPPEAADAPAAKTTPQPAEATDEPRRLLDRVLSTASGLLRQNAEAIAKVLGKGALGTGAGALHVVVSLFKGLTLFVFSCFLTLFFFFFLSSGYPKFAGSAKELIPQWSRGRTLSILGKMDRVIAAFIRGRLIIMAIMCLEFVVVYWLIGVPAALVVGLIAGILAIVPYLALVTIPACWLLMWLQPVGPEWQQTWWWIIFAPPVVYYVVQTTDDYFWTPKIQGKATDMDTPTILFTVLAGATLAGFYGVLVAIPVGACLKILFREAWYPRVKAWADGRVRDILPISRYSPLEAKATETKA